MMSKEANIRAILEYNFTGFKDEIIDTAVELICDLECESITSPSQHWAKQAENFGEIAMNEIDKARSCEDMRDATEEERKSTKDYIDSISKPTGLRFDDLYEEIDFVQPHKKIPCTITIGKPSEDCISRESVLMELGKYLCGVPFDEKGIDEVIKELPSVTPKTDVLNKIRDEIKEKIEQEEFARSVFRHEEKDAVKAEQCTGSIMAYNNVIKLIDKYIKESEGDKE